ncbi:peptide-N-glycosidase F-related protein [Rapidithrix thailandica]|uniref:Peptide-N-glycosidase F-related protein n=1 Tax=Rapidithrix thailandica TaxID=413964 RepID=A0AAW9RZ27_9BACT
MIRLTLLNLLLLVFANAPAFTQTVAKDTLVVQTFTFEDIEKRRGVFEFPGSDDTYEKILMVRTLKCDEATTGDRYPCGEWDYSTNTVIYVRKEDSTVESFEIEAFVTPYGKRLDLKGEKGWTYVYDVSDYAPLLKGKVDLSSGNTQELLDMKFYFIKGTPPRNILKVENIYPSGSYVYEDLSDDKKLKATEIHLEAQAKMFMLRSRISGHGHFGPRNCCEWDSKTHTYYLNEEALFRWNVWKDCGFNPIYPQGGTWPFDRAGWCPGTPVDTYDFELTRHVRPGKTITLDYGIEPYSDNGEKGGNFRMAHQLFSYGAPNFKNDARVMEIISPTNQDAYSRLNPSCKNPVILIQNTGSATLQSLQITYGLQGGKKETYQWSGRLEFLEKATVVLPVPSWDGLEEKGNTKFEVSVGQPNAVKDEYPANNNMSSEVEAPVKLPKRFILHIEANNKERARENGYTISNERGEVYFERSILEDEQVYDDVIELEEGCYEFRLTDQAEDGMVRHWWYRNSNPEMIGRNGRVALLSTDGEILVEFPYDFGQELRLQFYVGSLK